ncbi:helix-turn-helix domain-containing protein [Holdemania filiformis]|uniref:helix-turn-helix domain-containing protein n=1 Tax=Holdemania filiformis TaxID=61171 RepID=UPI002670A1F2|nr:helix-turn-helix domain-containing protein [Holdemania filiformis]
MNFAQKLQKRRKEVGFSQEQLAFELNVSRQAVSKWESGQGYPEVEKLIQLSELLGISLDELMKETREHPSAPIKPLDEEEQEWRDEPHSPVTLPDDIHEEDSLIGRFAYSTDRDTVERYLDLNQRFARWIAVGVGMILGGIIPVIVLDNDLGVAIMMFSSTVCSVSTTPMPLSYFHLSPSALAISSTPALLPELIASC